MDAKTDWIRKQNMWVDAEFYFYGKVTDTGGKDNVNIHLLTDEFGLLRIKTPIEFLTQLEDNIIYRTIGIYAMGKQNISTGKMDTSTLKFINIVNYKPQYDPEYLQSLRDKAQSWISSIAPDKWLDEIRGRE